MMIPGIVLMMHSSVIPIVLSQKDETLPVSRRALYSTVDSDTRYMFEVGAIDLGKMNRT